MAMFVYRPTPPADTAWIFAGSIATISGGKTYGSYGIDEDAGATAILGNPYIGISPTFTDLDAGATVTALGNRKFSDAVSLDAGASVSIRFVHMTSLSVYNEGVYKANTKDLDFSGSVVSVSGDIVTNTDLGAEEVPYATRIDEVSSTLMYKAEAVPGSLDAAAVWRISRLTFAADGDIVIHWAGGTSTFDKIWDNRLALSYS